MLIKPRALLLLVHYFGSERKCPFCVRCAVKRGLLSAVVVQSSCPQWPPGFDNIRAMMIIIILL